VNQTQMNLADGSFKHNSTQN